MCEPGDRPDGFGSKPKADAHGPRRERILAEPPRQLDGTDHARAVVVGLHRMAGVRLDKELPCFGVWTAFGVDNRRSDFESLFRVGDEFGFDDCMILFIAWKFVEGILRQAKSPITFIIFENPRDCVWAFLVEIQMRLEFFERKILSTGNE